MDSFLDQFQSDPVAIANHLELAYRAGYRELLYWFDCFRRLVSIPKEQFVSTMMIEYPELREDFPKFLADAVPVDLTERTARDRYGPPPKEMGYLHKLIEFFKTNWKTFVPPLLWLPEYKLALLPWDLMAGVTIGIFGVAQGLAYGILAELPPQVGLYTMTIPVFVYAFLGTSRQFAMGPFALIALLVAGAIAKVPAPAGATAVQIVAHQVQTSVNLMMYCGLFLTLFGILRFGFISNFISKSFLSGFTSASGLTIQSSQLSKFFGLTGTTSAQLFIDNLIQFFSHIATTHWPTLVCGLITLAALILMKVASDRKWVKIRGKAIPIPGALIVTILGILISWAADFQGFGIKTIGTIPAGFNPISMPSFNDFGVLFLDALILSLVVYLVSATVVSRYAEEFQYPTDSNQELLAYGVANIVGSFFSGFVASGAMSRSALASIAGARSQVYGLVTGLLVVIVLVAATGLLAFSPQTVLAATILMAAHSLWDFSLLPSLWRVRKSDFTVWWVAFLCTLFLGSQTGLLISMGFSIVLVVYRASTPHVATLGRLPQSTVWRDVGRFPEALCVNGLLVVRFDADFFFANISFIHSEIIRRVEAEASAIFVVILDLSTVADIDYSGAMDLKKTVKWLQDHNMKLMLVSVTGQVRDCMKRAGLLQSIGEENVFWLHQDAARAAKEVISKAINSLVPENTDDSTAAAQSTPGTLLRVSQFGHQATMANVHERPKQQKSFFERII